MTGINVGRVIGGGLLAGVLMNVVDGLTNGVILGARWAEETKRLGIDMSGAAQSRSLAGWVTFDFLCGIVLVWLYASIRPRYGPGPKTAVIAGLRSGPSPTSRSPRGGSRASSRSAWSPRRRWGGWWRPSRERSPAVR